MHFFVILFIDNCFDEFNFALYHLAADISSFSDMQSEGTYHLKILVPSVAAGAIIGKGGETIAQLQKDTTARVKMSKANDFYPGKLIIVLNISLHIKHDTN